MPDAPNGHVRPLAHLPAPASNRVPEEDDEPAPNPWEEDDFSPVPRELEHGDYYARGGRTYRRVAGRGSEYVCGFVPIPVGEIEVVHDLDDPASATSRSLVLRIVLPDGVSTAVTVAVERGKNLSSAIVDAVPAAVARCSVTRPNEVKVAASAFTSPTYFVRTMFKQTGWLPDGGFVFPGSEAANLSGLGPSNGLHLLRVPEQPSRERALLGATTLLRILHCAPLRVSLLITASVFVAPMFRRPEHLGARAFVVLLAGPSQAGKTTFLTRVYSLLGRFFRKPWCVATWRWTLPSLEALLHDLRDLPVLVDNFRAADGNARETFRQLTISVGDGAARGRTVWTPDGARVLGAPDPRSIVIASGEHGFDDDAAVNGRMIEVVADNIDKSTLLKFPPAELETLPDLFSMFVAYLGEQPASFWEYRRSCMHEVAQDLTSHADARTSENLATLYVAFLIFVEFVASKLPEVGAAWKELVATFTNQLDDLADAQARRVREDRVDEAVLREVARGIREGQVYLERIGDAARAPRRGLLLGAYDTEHLYLIPEVLTRWANAQLRRGRRAGAGRKELGWALSSRGNGDGTRAQRTFGGRRHGVWPVRRAGLVPSVWEGIFEDGETNA